jgi:hypothetical protein
MPAKVKTTLAAIFGVVVLLALAGLGAPGIRSNVITVAVVLAAAYGYCCLQSVEPTDRPPRR